MNVKTQQSGTKSFSFNFDYFHWLHCFWGFENINCQPFCEFMEHVIYILFFPLPHNLYSLHSVCSYYHYIALSLQRHWRQRLLRLKHKFKMSIDPSRKPSVWVLSIVLCDCGLGTISTIWMLITNPNQSCMCTVTLHNLMQIIRNKNSRIDHWMWFCWYESFTSHPFIILNAIEMCIM